MARSEPYTEKVDVYSFGLIVWQMATDKVPFSGLTTADFVAAVVTNSERPKISKSWPDGFSELLKSCWHQDFTKRPSFDEIVVTLQDLLQDRASRNVHSSSPIFSSLRKRAGSFF